MFDWQTILVTLFILAAALYVARRGIFRLRTFRAAKRNSPACDAGCGCSGGSKQAVEIMKTNLIGRST
jgi:hypothetical protein